MRRTRLQGSKAIFLLIFFAIQLLHPSASDARDINLDEIYLKRSSRYQQKLAIDKVDVYQTAGALFIDRDVIFAEWASGHELYYLCEYPARTTNVLSRYHLGAHRKEELIRIPGVITAMRVALGGGFIVMKRLIQDGDIVPRGETLLYYPRTGRLEARKSPHGFIDFSISPEGNSILHETPDGIQEFQPDTGTRRQLIARSRYAEIASTGNPSIAFCAPDRSSYLVINGGGGSYAGKLLGKKREAIIRGITSASEIAWIDANRIAYRSGGTGSFSVMIYNASNGGASALITHSYNTNIQYSSHHRSLSFLKDQLIHIYPLSEKKAINTGMEGEDVSFSPLGSRFLSLFNHRLFVINLETLRKRRIDLKKSWERILAAYLELRGAKNEWDNEYSLDYINRKIHIYSLLTKTSD